jgi:hypothetical protein
MRGVRLLKQMLGSHVAIHSADLDEYFHLPEGRFGLVCCFGILYHLKNPYYFLEKLARCSRHMLLSTRIISSVPGPVPGRTHSIADLPLAFFLRADELNQDNSNFWLFSKECLLRILERTHWEVGKCIVKKSTAASGDTDERAFLVLRSTYGASTQELLFGWHAPEHEGWRWTERRFGVRFTAVESAGRQKCLVKLYVPEQALGSEPLTLEAFVNGESIGAEAYRAAGDQTFARLLPVNPGGNWDVEFVLNRALSPDANDNRERGIIVAGCEIERVS